MMKGLFSIGFLAAVAAFALVACGESKKEEAAPRYLVLYYSQTGVTRQVAENIAGKIGADMEEIQVEEPYDSDYDATIERCRKEMEDSVIPKVRPLELDPQDYDVILIGYPVWFGTYARPIMGLLGDIDLAGKKVVPFCTFGSGGLESSVGMLRESLPDCEVLDGYGVRASRLDAVDAEVDRFLIESGLMEGEVEPLGEYSAMEPVGDEDKAVFDAACSGYRFPLGTPVAVGKRTTSQGTDYRFEVNGRMGEDEVTFTIYVTAGNGEGAVPEFTRVVR